MTIAAAQAIRAEHRTLDRVLGGISPIDASFMQRMKAQGVVDAVDVVAVHGFPLDWNHWQIDEWPQKLAEIRAVVPGKRLWVSEVGVSTFGAEEVQEFGVHRTARAAPRQVERVHWYSLYDLPRAWPATTRHREAEGSSYYRHFYMGLLDETGRPKKALRHFADYARAGRLPVVPFRGSPPGRGRGTSARLGVKKLRTGLSWADSFRPDADAWFDRLMTKLAPFDLTVTFCFTPEHLGLRADHTSPPREIGGFAEFCGKMTRRYAT